MPTPPESPESNPPSAVETLRARLRAVAEAEQSRREPEAAPEAAPPVVAAPPTPKAEASTGPSDLWETPKPVVEEPMSSFLVPVDELPPTRAELPKARVVSVPAEPPKAAEPDKISLEELCERVLMLLRGNEVDEAIAQQDTPAHDAPSPTIRTRWQLTRELLGVAKSLPQRVVQPIADAIGRDNAAIAKAELTEFRRQNPGPAKEADVVLRTRAKGIQRHVAGALYVEPPVVQPFQDYQPPSIAPRSSGGANIAWIVVVVVLAIIRIAVRTSSHSSYDYDYNYPSYNSSYSNYDETMREYERLAEQLKQSADTAPQVDYSPPQPTELTDEPPALLKGATEEEIVDDLAISVITLRDSTAISEGQREALIALWDLDFSSQCTETRTAMAAFEKVKQLKGPQKALAGRYIKAIRARVDRLCPKAKAKKKAAAPAPKVEMELTDSPPTGTP